ncbi:hypothetical protein DJ90_6405 [Paenibacillus macerans]|uniref:Uncharacterized protein n=1 Tax=Paenibacillus macerans TaxID=44252 RepID=A0A090ZJC1_PAEMA|nr:hypothetical protein DJ90_6405 [Paenibacillus macerans]
MDIMKNMSAGKLEMMQSILEIIGLWLLLQEMVLPHGHPNLQLTGTIAL